MTTFASQKTIITTFASHFEFRNRGCDGSSFVTLKDERPEWLKDAVYAAHQSDLPNDWIYAECAAAVQAFDEGQFSDEYLMDEASEYADSRIDIYTNELFQWAAKMCLSCAWAHAQEESDENTDHHATIEKRIAYVQFTAIRSIVLMMVEACMKAARTEGTVAP